MGVFDKFLDIMKLNDDDYDDDFYDEEDEYFLKQGDSDETSCIQKGWKYGSLCCKTKFC